jgi:hypothetical protein
MLKIIGFLAGDSGLRISPCIDTQLSTTHKNTSYNGNMSSDIIIESYMVKQ